MGRTPYEYDGGDCVAFISKFRAGRQHIGLLLLVRLGLRLLRVCTWSAPDWSLVQLMSLTLLVHLATLCGVWALRIAAISSIHLARRVLLSAVNRLLLGRVLSRSGSAGGGIADGWQLGAAHGRSHHMLRGVLGRWLGWSAILLSTTCGLVTLAFLLGLALVLLFLLLRLPLLAYFFEFCDEEKR